jgi:hypothetical protein
MISRLRIRTLLVSGLLLMCSACSEPPDYYFPLDPGRYWRYEMSYQTMDGTFDGVYAVENLTAEVRDDTRRYIRRLLDGSLNYFEIRDDGILLTGREKTINLNTTNVDEQQYIFKYPLQEGTRWNEETVSKVLIKTGPPQKTEFHIRAKVELDAVIESMSDTVSVPAGRFKNCMRVSFNGKSFVNAGNYVGGTVVTIKETNWYAPGVGLVKSTRVETTTSRALDRGELTLELESYR